MGKAIELITPHALYLALGQTDKARYVAYRTMFEQQITDGALKEIRDATNKAWVLGEDRFIQQIEAKTGRRVAPLGRDRKSKKYREKFDNH